MVNSQAHETAGNISSQTEIWHGDHLVENPDLTSDLVTEIPISLDELWAGARGITRIGPASEGYAGYLMPATLQRVVKGTNLEFMLPPTKEQQTGMTPRQLKVGASIPDGNGSEKLTVVDFDDVAKRITFQSRWYESNPDRQNLHYSWEIHAREGEKPDTSVLLTRTRIEGLNHPKLWQKAGPVADWLTMKLVRRGILEERQMSSQPKKKKLGAIALASSVIALGLVTAHRRRR